MLLSCALSVSAAPAKDGGAESKSAPDGGTRLPRRFNWEVPGIVSETEIPGVTWAMGVPVKMHAVTVKGKVEDSMRYLYDSFIKQGLYVEARLQMGPILTGVDPDNLMTYSAVFQENAPGYVTIVMGEANILKSKPPQGADFIPLFPGAHSVLRSSIEGSDTLVYFAPVNAEEKVRAFYKDALSKTGYQVDPQDPSTYFKGSEQVTLQTKLKDGQVSVFATRRGPAVQP
ncbi:MAG: hypothetical protein K1X64_22310 [Myxococcaceae bacterium]|nr:hypothetical protein [Myxococcaceae bacterium]